MKRYSIVILGSGFGGVAAACELYRRLPRGRCDVTVIDREARHLFTPLLYEVATANMGHEEPIAVRLTKGVSARNKTLLARWGAAFVQDEVMSLDWDSRQAILKSGGAISFDFLIVALGAETNFFGIPGLQERAFTLKTAADAERLRIRVHELLHGRERGANKRVDVVIGGAGATGAELAGELTMFFRRHIERGHIGAEDFNVTLIDAKPRILPMFDDRLSTRAHERLAALGINIRLNALVKRVESDQVIIGSAAPPAGDPAVSAAAGAAVEERIDADIVVWTGGVRGSSSLERLGLPLDARGRRIEVGPAMAVSGRENVYAIGDAALMIDPATKLPAPQLAQAAIDQGLAVGRNIARRLRGGGDLPLFFKKYPIVITLGGKYAVAEYRGRHFNGLSGWLLREAADLGYFRSILSPYKALRFWLRGVTAYTRND